MESEITTKGIESRILTIRNQQVMIDRDLAELYGVETRILNQAVKRNIERFPENFMFQLTREETEIWMSQKSNSNDIFSRSQFVILKSQIVMSSNECNTQYPTLTVNHTSKMHDRFLIIDNKILYHIGASLKDLGKKCFAFEIPDKTLIPHLLAKL